MLMKFQMKKVDLMSKMKLNGMGFMETQEKDVIIQKSKCIAYQINLIIIKIIQKMITY